MGNAGGGGGVGGGWTPCGKEAGMALMGSREWSRAHESRSLCLLAAPGLALHKPRQPGGLRPSHSPEQGACSSGGVQAAPSTQLRQSLAVSAGGWRGWSSITPSTPEGMGRRLAPAEPKVAQPRMQMWTKRVAGDSEAPSLESRWMWRYPCFRLLRGSVNWPTKSLGEVAS